MSEMLKIIPRALRAKLIETTQEQELNELATKIAEGQISIKDVDASRRPLVQRRLKKSPWNRTASL